MTVDLRRFTPSDLKEIAENVSAGLVVCQGCGLWTHHVYRVPKRYTRMKDVSAHDNDVLFDKLFGQGAAARTYGWRETVVQEAYECAYCIARRAEERKGRLKSYRESVKKCVGCGHEFVNKKRAHWEMSQTFGESPDLDWRKEWGRRRAQGIFYTDVGFDCEYCDDCMLSMREKRKSQSKELKRVNAQNTRTSKLGLVSDLTLEQWLSVLEKYRYKCAYCGGKFETMDHVVPVSFGGGTTADNVVPSCMPCNISAYHRHRNNMMLPIASEYMARMAQR